MDLSKALEQVNGYLLALNNEQDGDAFSYPSAVAIVHRMREQLHPYAVWVAVDPSRDGNDPFFTSGNYYETLEQAINDPRIKRSKR